MTLSRTLLSMGVAAVLLVTASACSSDDKTDKAAEPTFNPTTPVAPPFAEKDEGKNDKKVDYTVPAEAKDFCGVLDRLDALDKEQAGQTRQKAQEQLGERLELMAGTGNKLAEYTKDEKSKKQWSAMGGKYSEALDYFKSTGQNSNSDNFIVVLAEAADAQNSALDTDRTRIKDECDIDADRFFAGNPEDWKEAKRDATKAKDD